MTTTVESLETPALLIEESVLEANLNQMQELANDNGIALRPHIKTHKCPKLAHKQLQKGAQGIAVATLQEAEAMVESGITNIHLANEIATDQQIAHFLALSEKAYIACTVDHPDQLTALNRHASGKHLLVPVLIEVNTGLDRAGVENEAEAIQLGRQVEELPNLQLKGIMTHGGQAYGAANRQEVEAIGKKEGEKLVTTAEIMRESGLEVEVVSAGSTPTAPFAAKVKGVTELRVGNYIVNDGIQVSLGVAQQNACALSVLTSVISRPTASRIITDSGTKSLTSDQGAHGNSAIKGFGKVLGKDGHLDRLSEEHGVIENIDSNQFRMGEKLRILPNHACPVFNLFSKAYLVNGNELVDELLIEGKR